jgi:hypothetical protein
VTDLALYATIVIAFAAFATAHATIVYGLARRGPAGRAVLAFFVLPLGLYWAAREKMRVRAAVWIASAVGYLAARWIGRR